LHTFAAVFALVTGKPAVVREKPKNGDAETSASSARAATTRHDKGGGGIVTS
jgi:hypothetical protein